ncbi:hypothetical protein HDV02_004733 [Globomyces sp. JEL0801]|nr:hypothetical protein HDV02_004733 [Globomyces sp. JEL0801]
MCIQRRRRSQSLFAKIYSQLSRLPFSESEAIFDSLKSWFPKDGKIIFDEAQCCLELLNLDYRSCSSNVQPKVVNGQFTDPRSFFSFLTRTVIESGLKSIWCGTHMRIRSMDLFSSAAGNKIDEVCLFTDFNYLKPSEIFQLLSKWLNVDQEENLVLFEEIANLLQGRPRFITSFLHKLIYSSDINGCFREYARDMTTRYDPSLGNSSPYYFWEQRISWTFGPIDKKDVSAFEVRQVSDTLIRLCLSFLFGDGSSMDVSPGTDLVSTGLVMITKSLHSWQARMAEPLVLTAGLNFLADQGPGLMLDYFANKLFAPVEPLNSTPQERGHMMELVIALRFVQGWWLEPGMKKYLPLWAQHLNIQKPLGVIDCRLKESGVNMFVQQLRNAEFPWMILPAVNAGPDLRYSVFCCHIKTTSTPKSKSTMYVKLEECQKNIATMDPKNWYKSESNVQRTFQEELKAWQFIHLRFEMPDTAPAMKDDFKSGPKGKDHVICINLESEIATDFFGVSFIEKYKAFVSQTLKQ